MNTKGKTIRLQAGHAPVAADAMTYGENQLSITLTSGDPQASGEIVIDEAEVWVQPK